MRVNRLREFHLVCLRAKRSDMRANMKTYNLQHAGCFLFLGYTFLFDLIEKVFGHKLPFIMVFAGAALYFAALQKGEKRYLIPKAFAAKILPWILFMLLFVIPRNQYIAHHNYWSTIRWVLAVIIMILASLQPLGNKGIMRIILLYSLVHVTATWVLYFAPTLYERLYKLWGYWPSGTEQNFQVYRAGITNNYSRNTIGQLPALFLMAAVITVILLTRGMIKRINTARLLAAAAVITVTLGALLLTAKRSGVLFGIAAILLGFVVYKYKKINIAGIAGLGIAVLLLLLAASRFVSPLQLIISRFLELGKDNSTTSRIRMWKLALEMFARHPLIGNGWESFKFEYYAKLSARTGSMYDYLDAHNVYLQVLAETGLLGFALFIACIGTTFWTTYRVIQASDRVESQFDRTAALYSFMYQVYFILYCATGNCLYDITFIHYTVAAGLMYGVYLKTFYSTEQTRATYETYRYSDISQSV